MDKIATFAKRLQTLLDVKGITKAQLSRDTGISKSSLTHYVRGDWEAKSDAVYAIAKATMVRSSWLMGYDTPMDVDYGADLPPANLLPLEPMGSVPLVGQIACGTPILAEENIEEYVDLPRHIKADFALSCKGDSMTGAGIHDGDVVYIHAQPEVENGQIAAVLVDSEEATLKRFYQDGATVQLVAENPKYPPLVFIGDGCARIRVLGRAVAFTHALP